MTAAPLESPAVQNIGTLGRVVTGTARGAKPDAAGGIADEPTPAVQVAVIFGAYARIMTKPVALVTGASSGIGEAIANALLDAGWNVYAAARRTDRMANLGERGAHVVALDVTDDASMEACVRQVVDETGRIDALVNNAGYGSYGALEEVPIDEARRQFEVNVFGLARLTQLVTPIMRGQRSGRIVNISSMGAHIYTPLGAWYHATKFAVNGLSDSLRLELKPFGIDVVTIQPGGIKSEWAGISADSLEERSGHGPYAEQARALGAMLRGSDDNSSEPEVVARAVVAACTAKRPRSKYTIGSFAKPFVAARRVLPDRAMDELMSASVMQAPKLVERRSKRRSAQ